MNDLTKDAVKSQFGAAIGALERAIQACPAEFWDDPNGRHKFWYIAYHALFWLDYYLSESGDTFVPIPPFTMSETDPSGILPDGTYSKAELIMYLDHGRKKLHSVIAERQLQESRAFRSIQGSLLEVLLYNMRHVQHHAAQLNLILRETAESAPRWVSKV